jgi:hypothetical protein
MPTIAVHGSDGEVMAPAGSDSVFIRGKHRKIRVTKTGPDENTPAVIREALVGLEIPVIFDHTQLEMPEGAIAAYITVVRDVLFANKKGYAAQVLQSAISDRYDMYVFEAGTYELIG